MRALFLRFLPVIFAIWFASVASLPAQAAPDKIDFQRIYEFARLSAAAYRGADAIRGARPGVSWIATPGHTDVQYFIEIDHARRTQIIAERGTVDGTNWDLDIDTRGIVDKKAGILMHAGFHAAARVIYKDLKPHLRPGYATYLTGHSLGGAVAGIVAIYLRDDKVRLAGIYTFGQPKFTNAAGARAYRDLPLLRVIFQNDVVATLPDHTRKNGRYYAHIGPAINLLSGPHYLYIDAEQSLRLSQGAIRKFFGQISVPDHKMKYYLKSLRQKLDGARRVSFKDRSKHIVRRRPIGWGKQEPFKRKFNFNPHR